MSEQKFPPKILGSYDPESNNGRWQGPYQFCPEQWCIAYDKLGHTWAPTPGETRDVVFISEEEHQHLMAEKDKRIERLREELKFYADWRNYSVDYDTSTMGMSRRVILFSDQEEINEVTVHAGRRARAALQDDGK